ncbi:MAG: hypothetical protein H7039_22625 [Bryobacteraceae bacterium]|nr:hypothetical protein [Bryobacteraceae bacterium]
MIDVTQAVSNTTAYFTSVLPVEDVRLEEIETHDGNTFDITLSGLLPKAKMLPPGVAHPATLASLFKNDYERVYKRFEVDAVDGRVKSMKIRQI